MECFLCGVTVPRNVLQLQAHIKDTHSVTRNLGFVMIIFLLDFLEISDLVKEFQPRLDELKSSDNAKKKERPNEILDVQPVKNVDIKREHQAQLAEDDCIILEDDQVQELPDVMKKECQDPDPVNLPLISSVTSVKNNYNSATSESSKTFLKIENEILEIMKDSKEGFAERSSKDRDENEDSLEKTGETNPEDTSFNNVSDDEDIDLMQQLLWNDDDDDNDNDQDNNKKLSESSPSLNTENIEADKSDSDISDNIGIDTEFTVNGDDMDTSVPFNENSVEKSAHEKVNKILEEELEMSRDGELKYLKFDCEDCPEKFNDKDFLRIHRDVQHSKKLEKISCKLCYCQFSANQSLRQHEKLIHKQETEYLDRNLSSEDLKFQCSECDLRFISENSMIYHLVKIHYAERGSECTFCKKTLNGSRGTFMHYWKCHKMEIKKKGKKSETEYYKSSSDLSKVTEHAFDNSVKAPSPINEDAVKIANHITEDSVKKAEPITEDEIKKAKPITEQRCKLQKIHSEDNYDSEMSKEDLNISCPQCDLKFESKRSVLCHQIIVHLVTQGLSCFFCGKTMKQTDAFQHYYHGHVKDISESKDTTFKLNDTTTAISFSQTKKRKITTTMDMNGVSREENSNQFSDSKIKQRLNSYKYKVDSVCKFCGKLFQWKQSLNLHLKKCQAKPSENPQGSPNMSEQSQKPKSESKRTDLIKTLIEEL